ncbi:MAG: single-stranded DNA-binding protein [Gammaproteobacteria bacterium]|nr:single-stranded DNA-binding protein [Gammaproteobacteria bacterium]
MANINNCVIEGNLVRDANLKDIGKGLCEFSIANNIYVGKEDDYANFFDCTLWGPRAGKLTPYLKKGTRVVIVAQAKQERWDDKETGKGRSKTVFNVSQLSLAPRGQKQENEPRQDEYSADSHPAQEFSDQVPF